MKQKRKIFAILVAFAMLIGGIPVGAFDVHANTEHCDDPNECLVCTIADMINELPATEEINIDNAASVVAQIHAVDRIKGNLSEDEYDEMIQMVEAGNDGSGHGVDVPLRYKDAVEAVNKLNAGGSLYIVKKYSVGDEELDWSVSDATFKIERIDGGIFESLSVTLSDILVPTVGYQPESDGWTNTYPLPAGTYRITETGYHALTMDGKELTTTPTCSFDGQEGTNSAVVTIESGEAQTVAFSNTYRINVKDFDKLETITETNGISVEDLRLLLPNKIGLVTDSPEGNYDGTIEWALDGFDSYYKDKLEEQTITIYGTVSLPDGVYNDNKISLVVTQKFVILQRQIPDQDGDNKPEPDTDGDGIYEGTADDKTYIPDQDDDGKYEVDDDNDQIFDNENDDKHYVPDGNGGFDEYSFTYEVSDDVLTWTLGGTEDLTYTVYGPAEKFDGLKLDGTAVDAENYSYVSGSTIITLKANYLNSLNAGEYPLVADYVDGSGETTLKIVAATTPGDGEDTDENVTPGDNADDTTDTNGGDKDSASDSETDRDEDPASDTGDKASPLLWFIIMMAAVGAAVVTRKIKA